MGIGSSTSVVVNWWVLGIGDMANIDVFGQIHKVTEVTIGYNTVSDPAQYPIPSPIPNTQYQTSQAKSG